MHDPLKVRVCDLPTSTCRDIQFPIPPNNPKIYFSRMVGITSTHPWMETNNDRMFRLAL